MSNSISVEELRELASRQLGLPFTLPVPMPYLEELKKHVDLYRDDTHFRVRLQPGVGFGTIRCLEKGCEGEEFSLTQSINAPDGGRKLGFGSLASYRTHINNHNTHKRERVFRIDRERRAQAATERSSVSSMQNAAPFTTSPASLVPLKRGIEAESAALIVKKARQSWPKPTSRPMSGMSRSTDPFSSTSRPDVKSSARLPLASASVTQPAPIHDIISLKSEIVKLEEERGLLEGRKASVTKRLAISRKIGEAKARLGLLQEADYSTSVDWAELSDPPVVVPASPQGYNELDIPCTTAPNMAQLSTPQRMVGPELRNYSLNIKTASPEPRIAQEAEFYINHQHNTSFSQPYTGPNFFPIIKEEYTNGSSLREMPSYKPQALSNMRVANDLSSQYQDATFATSIMHEKSIQPPSISSAQDYGVIVTIKDDPSLAPLFSPGRKFNTDWQKHLKVNLTVKAEPMQPNLALPQNHRSSDFIPSSPESQETDVKPTLPSSSPISFVEKKSDITPHQYEVVKPKSPYSFNKGTDESDSDIGSMSSLHIDPYSIAPPDVKYNTSYDDIYGAAFTNSLSEGSLPQPADIDHFLMNAGNAEHFDGNASVDRALIKLGLPTLYTHLPGMTIALMPHQVIGVAWMLSHEQGHNKGGVMADEMGLGKTVQMISLMVVHPPQDFVTKTSLVVVPVALLGQWKEEIEMKTDGRFKVLTYYGPNRPKDIVTLKKHDIIITTHSTLALEWFDFETDQKNAEKAAKKRKKGNDEFIDDSDNIGPGIPKRKKKSGILYQMEFYRVIIDEAQNIRNMRTRISRAVTHLDSKYRWLLTGTPIVNSLGDAYAYMRFLKIRPWYDWKEFKEHIMKYEKKRPSLASERLQAIFSTTLIRRKKDSELDGKRLIELPEKTIELHKLEFSPEERDIYAMVEAKSQDVFNKYLRAGTVLKNYAHVLVMLLRLRQICSHPSLIQEDDGDDINFDEIDDQSLQRELAQAIRDGGREFVAKVRDQRKQLMLQRMIAEKSSADAMIEDEECPICCDHFTDPVVTTCAHQFCRQCIGSFFDTPGPESHEEGILREDKRLCPSCRTPITRKNIYSRVIFEPSKLNLDLEVASDLNSSDIEIQEVGDMLGKLSEKRKTRKSERPKRRTRRLVISSDEEDDDDYDDGANDFIVYSDEDENTHRGLTSRLGKGRLSQGKANDPIIIPYDDNDDVAIEYSTKPDCTAGILKEKMKRVSKFLPSTKMKRMMELLKEWLVQHPGEKTMVVSQWTQCLNLVSEYLNEERFSHVRYQGDMNQSQRKDAIHTFMKTDQVQVMLMSLKCGGVGLNLARANRVISLDLGWSEAVEAQAFDRVHRLGQVKPVYVNRLVISNTVEDRVLALQERKKSLADGSLGEGTGKKIGRLSVRELASLFGLDHRGRVLQ